MQMVTAPVARVPVVSDPTKRRPGMVLHWLRPMSQRVDVVPAAVRARLKIHGQTQRMLATRRVPSRRVAGGDRDVIAPNEVLDVWRDALVDQFAGRSRDRHEAPTADDPA